MNIQGLTCSTPFNTVRGGGCPAARFAPRVESQHLPHRRHFCLAHPSDPTVGISHLKVAWKFKLQAATKLDSTAPAKKINYITHPSFIAGRCWKYDNINSNHTSSHKEWNHSIQT